MKIMLLSLVIILVIMALAFYIFDQITTPSNTEILKIAKIVIIIIAIVYLALVLTGHGFAIGTCRNLLCS